MITIILTKKQFKSFTKRGYTRFMEKGTIYELRKPNSDPVQSEIEKLEARIKLLKSKTQLLNAYKMSPEARQKISEARKAYWRRIHESNQNKQ